MNTLSEKNFSIVIPTFREAKNISALVQRIAQINFGDRQFEVIFVDDNSQDGIIDIVKDLSELFPWVKILIRNAPRCLSQAVIDGFQLASYPLLICMDADLSHPPEIIPAMLTALDDADFVIGSRYIDGGSTDELWPTYRKFSSRCAALIANLVVFSHGKIKDPLSGFFAVRKQTFLAGPTLNPIGWKIGLEMMVKYRCKKIREVPIHFSERFQGRSKFTAKVMMKYLQHVKKLVWFRVTN